MKKRENVLAEFRVVPQGCITPMFRDALVHWLETEVIPKLRESTCGEWDFCQPKRIHRFKTTH
jgi:hypothetical protein